MILAVAAFALASATFKPQATMPMSTVYTRCGGANRSPELHWSGEPAGTRSFALVVHDPDAPHPGGWYHWALYDIPAALHELSAGAAPPGATAGVNSFGESAYDGPCPPAGKPHHYVFSLYALDVATLAQSDLTAAQLEAAVARHTLGRATMTGVFGR